MKNPFSTFFRTLFPLSLAGLMLAGCTPDFGGTSTGLRTQLPDLATAQPAGEILGTGQVRVAMLLPLSAEGGVGELGQSIRNAASLALGDFANNDIQLIIKDTAGNSNTAQLAARQAIDEGAEIILGPLISANVKAAGAVARVAGRPLIGFSTDVTSAGRGVYLLSFLPQSDVNRIVAHAAGNGRRAFAAMLPQNAYGTVVEAAFRTAVAENGGRVVAIERYSLNADAISASVQRLAASKDQFDAVFLPDSGDAVPLIADNLAKSGINTGNKMIIGTGTWDDPRVQRSVTLTGGRFPAPDNVKYQQFRVSYLNAYGVEPPRKATLGYDAVSLAIGLVIQQGAAPFRTDVLTDRNGFIGVDGVFRFSLNGTNQRGLAVYEISDQSARVIEPAPVNFNATGF